MSLEEIVRKKLKQQEQYEARYGDGSFNKNILSEFIGKNVTVRGKVVSYVQGNGGKRFVIKNVIVHGRELDHLNIMVHYDNPWYYHFDEARKHGADISFRGDVHRYRTYGGRKATGVMNPTKVKVLDETVVIPKMGLFSLRLDGLHQPEIDGLEVQYSRTPLRLKRLRVDIGHLRRKKSDAGALIDAVLMGHVKNFFSAKRGKTGIERILDSYIPQFSNEKLVSYYVFHRVHLSEKNKKVFFSDVYEELNFLERQEGLLEELATVTENIPAFLEYFGFTEHTSVVLPDILKAMTGAPVALRNKEGKLLIFLATTHVGNCKHKVWEKDALLKLASLFKFPTEDITVVNLLNNQIATFVPKEKEEV